MADKTQLHIVRSGFDNNDSASYGYANLESALTHLPGDLARLRDHAATAWRQTGIITSFTVVIQ